MKIKKHLSLILALIFVFSAIILSACNSGGETTPPPDQTITGDDGADTDGEDGEQDGSDGEEPENPDGGEQEKVPGGEQSGEDGKQEEDKEYVNAYQSVIDALKQNLTSVGRQNVEIITIYEHNGDVAFLANDNNWGFCIYKEISPFINIEDTRESVLGVDIEILKDCRIKKIADYTMGKTYGVTHDKEIEDLIIRLVGDKYSVGVDKDYSIVCANIPLLDGSSIDNYQFDINAILIKNETDEFFFYTNTILVNKLNTEGMTPYQAVIQGKYYEAEDNSFEAFGGVISKDFRAELKKVEQSKRQANDN